MTGFSAVVRQQVRERAGIEGSHVKCEICGAWTDIGQIHHRRARGMGSTKRPESNLASNAISVCMADHHMIEQWRSDAMKEGWLVRQWESPAGIPAHLHDGWFFLADDGSRVAVPAVVEDDADDEQRLTWRTV